MKKNINTPAVRVSRVQQTDILTNSPQLENYRVSAQSITDDDWD